LITRENLDHYKGWEEPTLAERGPKATPIAKDPRVVPILYATNRVLKTDAASKVPQFSSERSQNITFGSAAVRVPEKHKIGAVERPWEFTVFGVTLWRAEERDTDHFTLPEVKVLTK
jgi:hypothetical protein